MSQGNGGGMKGIGAALLAAAPLAAVVLYFSLSGQQEIKTEQRQQDVHQRVEEAKFDLEFERMSKEISGETLTPEKEAERLAEIDKLRKDAADLDAKAAKEQAKAEQDLAELEAAFAEEP